MDQDNHHCAPIALFAYNRLEHTRRTVEALRNNLLAEQSDLIVYSDGPKNEAAKTGVDEVRAYIRGINGFRSVRIVERSRNFGLAKSIISGVTGIVNARGTVIVFEDDLVTSPYFLTYMNEALKFYVYEKRVVSIHGYSYPVNKNLPETFFIRGADCWGWATWKRGWDFFRPEGAKLLQELEARNLTEEFDFGRSYGFTAMLRAQIAGKNDSWAVRWYASAFLADRLTLYPGISLVDNIGHDTTGTHSKQSEKYRSPVSERKIDIRTIPLEENIQAKKIFSDYLRGPRKSFFEKIKSLFS